MKPILITSHPSPITKRAAFTLIELLVVISVIALLLTLLMPALRSARNQARKVMCRANLRQFGQVLAAYVEENEGRLPLGRSNALWLLRGSVPGEQSDPNVPDVVQRTRMQKAALCPMATKPEENGWPMGVHGTSSGKIYVDIYGTAGSTFRAWTITSPLPEFHGSYGFNLWLFGGSFGEIFGQMGNPEFNVFTSTNRARMPILLDCPSCGCASINQYSSPPEIPCGGARMEFCINRHNGRVNGLFLDWSAREIGVKELWTLKWTPNFNTTGPWTLAGGVQPEDWPEWMRGFKDY